MKNDCSLNQVYSCPNCCKMKKNDIFGGAFSNYNDNDSK